MSRDSARKNWFEWGVFAVGLLLTLGAVGVIGYEAATQDERRPPDVEVRLGAAERRTDHWAVPVTLENRGDETAENVHVGVTLRPAGGGREETADFTVGFLPGRGTREGWVTFRSDPAAGEMNARPLGYERP